MKFVVKGALLMLLTMPAFGQRFISAPAASGFGRFGGFGSFGSFPNNIPASVTSFRPGFPSTSFGGPFVFPNGRFLPGKGFMFVDPRLHRRFGFFPAGFATGAYTGAYIIPDESQLREQYEQLKELMKDAPAPATGEPQKLEITIVDSRESRNRSEVPAAEFAVKPESKVAPPPEPQELSPTIVILQNGTRKELRNYAIMGKDLFDLADGKMFRIPLDTVDVDATVAANAANGKLFRLP